MLFTGWVRKENIEPFLEQLAALVDYDFDDWDRDAIIPALAETDADRRQEEWYDHPFCGRVRRDLRLAGYPGGSIVSMVVTGPDVVDSEARVNTLAHVMALCRITPS